MDSRIDPFSTIHKAVRRLLFLRAMELGATDFEDEGELRTAVEDTWFAMTLLKEHAEHEDQVTFAAVIAKDAVLGLEAAAQHAALEATTHELGFLLDQLSEADPAQRSRLGSRLRSRWNAFVTQQLEHLAFEEDCLSPVLWRGYTDAELATMMARIQGSVPPERMLIWRTLLLPSIDRQERARLQAAQMRRDAA
ncbi:MAG TPA: hypothetical protein VM686_04510 [Polyangiaceae bacterium]|nr:hypothetical protein [Polyangiaceae bacterium]